MSGLDAQRWQKISPYLDEALDLEPQARAAWLCALAVTDQELAATIASLLDRHTANGGRQFLEHSPLTGSEPVAGDQIGAYSLLRPLGQGGMGSVWLARRSDGHFEGQVAIKILARRALGDQPMAQIRHEAGLLAQLSHPNIARLFDAGVRENVEPYLILEYVDGQRIDEFCRAHGLDVPARLRLYLSVLDAVGHAHSHHIVHRDLKPTNVLVSAEGIPKLLDFGVASLLRAAPDPGTGVAVPHAGMTPGYAAPEQIRGEEVSAASDVYALGVMLYLLVTDRHPHDAASTHTQLIRATLTEDSPTASVAMGASPGRRWVQGDLDAVLAKATHKAAGLRYATASEFAADLRRVLAGQPVAARKHTIRYRCANLARRLWGTSAESAPQRLLRRAATVSATTLLATVGFLTWWATHRQPGPVEAAFYPPPHSIAVLPFTNEGGNSAQEYFSNGLTDEIQSTLSRVDDLLVSGRTSAFHFRSTDNDVGAIGRALNVAAILEGSVRRSATTVRVTARLIDTVNGFQMWSQSYDRPGGDAVAIQTDIGSAVSAALQSKLLGGSVGKFTLGGTRNAQAYDEFLQALNVDHLPDRKRSNIEAALVHYQKAIDLDPQFARPYIERVADLYYTSWVFQKPKLLSAAHESAVRGVALAPTLADAHIVLAWLRYRADLDFKGAAAEFERALALAPGSARALKDTADFFGTMGHCEAGISAGRRAVQLDPLDPDAYVNLSIALDCAKRYEEEFTVLESARRIDPNTVELGVRLGGALLALRQPERARASCLADHGDHTGGEVEWCQAHASIQEGRLADARSHLARLLASQGDAGACFYASIYAQLGDKAQALRWLKTAESLHDPQLVGLKTDETLDPLRQMPEFKAILARLNFPD